MSFLISFAISADLILPVIYIYFFSRFFSVRFETETKITIGILIYEFGFLAEFRLFFLQDYSHCLHIHVVYEGGQDSKDEYFH